MKLEGLNSPGHDQTAASGAQTAPVEAPLVLTVAEVARALRLGRTATYNAIKEGRIPHIVMGRRILVPRASLLKMLDAAFRA